MRTQNKVMITDLFVDIELAIAFAIFDKESNQEISVRKCIEKVAYCHVRTRTNVFETVRINSFSIAVPGCINL